MGPTISRALRARHFAQSGNHVYALGVTKDAENATKARDLLASWAERHDTDPDKPTIPAATVCVLRDGPDGLDTLMLRRNSKLAFAGGMWVFPGGRIDPVDYADEPDDLASAARRAAVREAHEESGQQLTTDDLRWFAHWTPPSVAPKRFATWFFACRASNDEVQIDGGEIHDSAWMTPADTLAKVDSQEIELTPPTWVTLNSLLPHDTVADALQALSTDDPEFYVTKVLRSPEGPVAFWESDAAYQSGDLDTTGPRHRLLMAASGFRFEQST